MKGVENEVFWSRLRLEDKVKKKRGIWSFTENSHNKHKLRRKDEQGIKGHTSFNYVKHGVEMDRLYKSRTGCKTMETTLKSPNKFFLKTRRKNKLRDVASFVSPLQEKGGVFRSFYAFIPPWLQKNLPSHHPCPAAIE